MNEYKYSDINIGMEEGFEFNITEDMLSKFKDITGDINPLHNDLEFARENHFDEKVVYGMLTSSFFSTLAGVYLPGKYSLIHNVEIIFKKPVFVSDSPFNIRGKVIEKNDIFKQITIQVTINNNKNQKVCRGIMKVGFLENG